MNNIYLPFLSQRTINFFLSILFFLSFFIYPQDIKIDKIEPPNWWVGMNWNKVQLMVYGENLNDLKVSFNDKEIKILKIHKIENPSYAFIDIEVPSYLKSGDYEIQFQNDKSEKKIIFSILERENAKEAHSGFYVDDIIYLIMPDRFANGDTTNDIIKGYGTNLDRSKGSARHGGDLQGIIDHLDYIKELGFTAIWLNPVIENNTEVSYHGYGATDFYKVDPRHGTNELYKKFVDEAHKRGIKVILDHVANHIHSNHHWMKNLPFSDRSAGQENWVNGSPENPSITNHDKIAFVDIHSDTTTLSKNADGWFTTYMPDLNQKNPFMANYIIQNTIWWMEYAGLDGIREDTYPYPDAEFMAEWAKAILAEYPNTNIVGEVWKGDPLFLSTYQEQSIFTPGFNSNLPSLTDFGLADALRAYLSGSRNLTHIYEILGMDFVYHNPDNLVTFIDNHDVQRVMRISNEDVNKVKIALQILLTTRGIPQIYYGTELGIVGGEDDGSKRTDFPGGFPGDERNAFTSEGRTKGENDLFNLIKNLIEIRKKNKALSQGKLIHFPPKQNVYIYFRILDDEKIMIVVNGNKEEKEVDLKSIEHLLTSVKKLQDLKTGVEIELKSSSIIIKPEEVNIYKIL